MRRLWSASPYGNLSVRELVYFDAVGHALERWHKYPEGYSEMLLSEADSAGRRDCVNADVRDVFRCMDLGLSPIQCTNYIADEIKSQGWVDVDDAGGVYAWHQ